MIQVDPRSLVGEVPAAMRLDRMEATLLAKGLTFGPLGDVAAEATLGDALRARAGRRSPRYGDIWDRVLAIEAALPGGRVFVTKATPRAATGPDITRTILEARGALGEIRKAWLRLWAAPKRREGLGATATSFEAALSALGAVVHSGARPAEVSVEGTAMGARLAMRFEGDPVVVEAEQSLARRILAADSALTLTDSPPTLAATAGAPSSEDGGPPFLCEGAWTELPARIAAARARLQGGAELTFRLQAVAHEGAVVSAPWPRGVAREGHAPTAAAAYLGRIAVALARRCA